MKSYLRLLLMVLFCLSTGVQAEIFKWIDKNGQVHYDDKPPVENKSSKQLMQINENSNAVGGLSDERHAKRKKLIDAIDEDRQLKKDEVDKAKKQKAEMMKRCHNARDNLLGYQRSSYVYDLDKEGNRVVLPSAARDQIIANLQKQIARDCAK
ncbi:MAG: DUF4124 domain-containing protein [Gammaproteobacteria bacterium]|nr:DUF4124 domain-containing protein [Gammaproteobacteria bacterium]